jgi:hypothetical protein
MLTGMKGRKHKYQIGNVTHCKAHKDYDGLTKCAFRISGQPLKLMNDLRSVRL